MGFRTLCIESRCKCTYASGYLVVTNSDRTTRVHLSEITSVTFCTTQAVVSAYLLSELAKAKIPVVFSDDKYLPVAECLPIHGAYNNAAHIANQIAWTLPSKKRLWQRVVKDKITLQARVLLLNGKKEVASVLLEYAAAVRSGDSDNREAVAAGLYFPALFGTPYTRNLECSLNTSLDYGYTVLLSRVAREIAARGYLTQVGIHHRSDFNSWNFACDLMEPFRPYIDAIVVKTNLDRFDTEMRRQLLGIMDNVVKYDNGSYKLGSVISYYVRDCLDVLEKRKEPSDIKCYEIV